MKKKYNYIMIALLVMPALCSCKQDDPLYFPNYDKIKTDSLSGEYRLVWSDEFDQPRDASGKCALPNIDNWKFETGGSGWGNQEE